MLDICVTPHVHLSLISTETEYDDQKMATISYGGPHASVVIAYRLMSALLGKDNGYSQYGFVIFVGGGCVQCYQNLVCV